LFFLLKPFFYYVKYVKVPLSAIGFDPKIEAERPEWETVEPLSPIRTPVLELFVPCKRILLVVADKLSNKTAVWG
jgi:hypothetical protein